MRHCTEEEKAAYEAMLEHMLVPLYPAPIKVWMVHRESGEYSDWTYDVKGIFSNYELARKYIESQLVMKCYHYVGTYRRMLFHVLPAVEFEKSVDLWDVDENRYSNCEQAPDVVETSMTRLVAEDELTFWGEYPDGSRAFGSYGYEATWYITEYGVDDEFAGKVG